MDRLFFEAPTSTQIFTFDTPLSFIVEERLLKSPDQVNFAWSHSSKKEAEESLVELVREYGATRFYAAYILVN